MRSKEGKSLEEGTQRSQTSNSTGTYQIKPATGKEHPKARDLDGKHKEIS